MAHTQALTPPRIPPGTEVQVRTRYLFSWASGFELVAFEGDRVRLRRRSDGSVLPVAVPIADVRPRN